MDCGARKRLNGNHKTSSVEDQALDQMTKEAEAKLTARRQARAEAREIRLRELERLQKEQEENADKSFELLSTTSSTNITPNTNDSTTVRVSSRNSVLRGSQFSSRRSSEDSLEDGYSYRELRHELRELEEKFRKAMITNAQLDNDKSACTYQIELLKDRIEELEDDLSRVRKDFKECCRERDQTKRSLSSLQDDFNFCKAELDDRDRMISEYGLTIVSNQEFLENGFDTSANDISLSSTLTTNMSPRSLVKIENAQVLKNTGHGSLDVRLQKLIDEKCELEEEISKLRCELDEEKKRSRSCLLNNNLNLLHSVGLQNGLDPDCDPDDIQREIARQLADYKFRTQKAEQDVATLQTTVSRLESQVIRYKSAAEASEKAEEELKSEKRKLQREARESQNRVEELETENSHLQKRLDKLKVAKSTLLKEL